VFFDEEELDAVVFDDAHTAEHLLRDHFSLKISKEVFPETYSQLAGLFETYHRKIGKISSYRELEKDNTLRQFMIPPFEVVRCHGEISRLLDTAGLSDNIETAFAWKHLIDYIDLCCILVSSRDITITPPFIPVRTLSYFEDSIRRIYLSATMSGSDAFARTFGTIPDRLIAPTTTAGECERLVALPACMSSGDEDREMAKELVRNRKALILVPSYSVARKWRDVVSPPPRNSVSEYVKSFKSNEGTPKLLLTARYDGIDLPGDMCRIMVIDDLPMGVGPLEQFLWERLKLSNTLRTAIASRIVQSFGRISRGLSDHGIVILAGDRLVKWLLTPMNIAALPRFLQKQIGLGITFSKTTEYVEDYDGAIDQCLDRDEGWLNAYADFMENADVEDTTQDIEEIADVALAQSKFAAFMWHREYVSAAKCLRDTLEAAFNISRSTGAWHALWLGVALQFTGDRDSAIDLYRRAHAEQLNIPPYPTDADGMGEDSDLEQIVRVDRQFRTYADGKVDTPKTLEKDLSLLDGSGSAAQTEESLRALGQYLGFQASRPDSEHGTGPDVLWEIAGMPCLCIEAKTDKKATSNYRKQDVGQLMDHIQWTRDNTDSEEIVPVFVGPVSPATESANPPEELMVIPLESFKLLGQRLVEALNDIATNSMPLTLRSDSHRIFEERDLLWPAFLDGMDRYPLKNLNSK